MAKNNIQPVSSKFDLLLSELKSGIEFTIRKVVREELDYYFEKHGNPIKKELVVDRQSTSTMEEHYNRRPQSPSRTNHTPSNSKLNKYQSELSRLVFEETSPFTEEDQVGSILDDRRLDVMANDSKLSAVHEALTRDYSSLVNAMNKK